MPVPPDTPAGARAATVLQLLRAMSAGAPAPGRAGLAELYTPAWLGEVPAAAVLEELAPLVPSVIAIRPEPAPRHEARALLDLGDGRTARLRCVVEAEPPHRIRFQIVSPAAPAETVTDRVVARDGRIVHVRDHGGDGPLLLLWHGSGCDATVWDGVVPHLAGHRVVAQDLPGHGRSPLPRLTARDAIADADAVVAELAAGDPVVVGHSLGGWLALRYAATRPTSGLVCLDGPTALTFSAMGLTNEHPGFVADPPDVPADLAALRAPATVALCRGADADEEAWMVPFRTGLAEHLTAQRPGILVEWLPTHHMVLLSMPERVAELVADLAARRG